MTIAEFWNRGNEPDIKPKHKAPTRIIPAVNHSLNYKREPKTAGIIRAKTHKHTQTANTHNSQDTPWAAASGAQPLKQRSNDGGAVTTGRRQFESWKMWCNVRKQ